MGNRHRGLDPPALQAWQLGAVDLDGTSTTFDGATATLRGRSQLTGGAARTLHDAITDWLAAEDALDKDHAGGRRGAGRRLPHARQRGEEPRCAHGHARRRAHPAARPAGARRPAPAQRRRGREQPAPIAPPHLLLAGCATLQRARVLDAFGRTLELPGAAPSRRRASRSPIGPARCCCARACCARRAGCSGLVDAATPVGAEGTEARVDQWRLRCRSTRWPAS